MVYFFKIRFKLLIKIFQPSTSHISFSNCFYFSNSTSITKMIKSLKKCIQKSSQLYRCKLSTYIIKVINITENHCNCSFIFSYIFLPLFHSVSYKRRQKKSQNTLCFLQTDLFLSCKFELLSFSFFKHIAYMG